MKWRLFRHLITGEDADAVRVYLWHIEARSGARLQAGLATDQWKRSLDDYLDSAQALALSMARYGFFPSHAIPVDPDGELLGGAHRLACALALELPEVPVLHRPERAWAPAWGEAWFVANGCLEADLERIRRDYGTLVMRGAQARHPEPLGLAG